MSDPNDKPQIVRKHPEGLILDFGEYHWCSCGKSKNQPFCDDSHHTTNMKPIKFTVSKFEKLYLCMCKNSNTKPFCDGTHGCI